MRKIILYFSVISCIILLSIFLLTFLFSYLTYTSPVKANILVVEGWMPYYGLNKAYQEYFVGEYDYVIITGSRFQDHITTYINSYMIFYPHHENFTEKEITNHIFEIHATSTIGIEDSAHFVFWINDEIITEHFTPEQKGRFEIHWEGNINDIDSLMIQFDNDMVGKKGDRNLMIKKFRLNSKNLIIENADIFLDRGRPFGEYRWNVTATSYAELAAHFFVDGGIDPAKVIPVSNNYPDLRRTYGNALSLRERLSEKDILITGINVVSMDNHSRRTWITYNRLLNKYSGVGIISAADTSFQYSRRRKYFSVLRESVAMIYYCIFIFPWM